MTRIVLVFVATLVLVLGITGLAQAATPQDIYNDYATDGSLDGVYTDEELQAYLDDAVVHQYGDDSVIDELDRIISDMLTDEESRDTFPFTGAELMLMGAAAVLMIGGGLALRRATTR